MSDFAPAGALERPISAWCSGLTPILEYWHTTSACLAFLSISFLVSSFQSTILLTCEMSNLYDVDIMLTLLDAALF